MTFHVPVPPASSGCPAPAVETHELRKEFRRRVRSESRFARRRMPALNGITFTIERGECVAILGRNGSGKSTLVRLLSTLLLHDGGTARIFGHDAFSATPRCGAWSTASRSRRASSSE